MPSKITSSRVNDSQEAGFTSKNRLALPNPSLHCIGPLNAESSDWGDHVRDWLSSVENHWDVKKFSSNAEALPSRRDEKQALDSKISRSWHNSTKGILPSNFFNLPIRSHVIAGASHSTNLPKLIHPTNPLKPATEPTKHYPPTFLPAPTCSAPPQNTDQATQLQTNPHQQSSLAQVALPSDQKESATPETILATIPTPLDPCFNTTPNIIYLPRSTKFNALVYQLEYQMGYTRKQILWLMGGEREGRGAVPTANALGKRIKRYMIKHNLVDVVKIVSAGDAGMGHSQ
ncbi:hypothetical protein L873DRAFT_1845778 [Choiromyces venosus 120613-1]|uniref:Uncharacterized protein n=1 Tax=Choiromyces venosus 120613-1 TaxID=1336337 RepID=A0A3N4JPK5_9PEZI|nr:hypothetical protein L873DRAFT_1845778 [Choiromyces venosus 120613-1]